MNRSFFPLFTVVICLLACGVARADDLLPPPKLPGESLPTARRLAEARQHADRHQWGEAVEEYQRILDEAGDDLVPLDPQKRDHCLQARQLCAMQLPRHATLLSRYRARVDEQAKKWLEEGIAERDPIPLRRLVDRAFCSRHGDRALDLLGDLAFERGDLAEAEQWWRLLARPASLAKEKSEAELVYPDPRVDVALVRAKVILSRMFRGERDGARAELSAFAALHGKAEGRLAGRTGKLVEILQDAARHADQLTARAREPGWPTVGGGDSRAAIAPKAPRCRWLEKPWSVRLDDGPPIKSRPPTQQAQACVFQPVIAGGLVLLADDRSVTAYDLFTGRQRGRWELPDERPNGWNASAARQYGARYTLTVAGNRVYVRLGTPPMPPFPLGFDPRNAVADSHLVCLPLPPTGEGQWMPCWQVKPRGVDAAFFEGSPLVHGAQVFIGRTHFAKDGQTRTAIDCYRADTGAFRWRRDICEVREADNAGPRYHYSLLTRAGPNLVYCSDAGAIVAIDAGTGQPVWATRYPRRGPRLADGNPSPRDLAPAVYADGRLFVAPADLDHVLCLDAATGRTLWESNVLEVAQLLGVARGKLIFTTASFPAGIRAVDAATGRDQRGWMQPSADSNGLPTVGRGLLAGDWVLWPTVNGLRILTQEEGEPAADAYLPLDNTIRGNLATAQGCLVTATDRELLGYVPPAKFLAPRRKDAKADPGNARKRFRLGLAHVGAGSPEAALAEFEQAEKLTASAELRRQAQRERHAVLLLLAEQAAKSGQPEKATILFQQAAAADFPVPLRLTALAGLAEHQTKCRHPEEAVAAWQTILADAQLRRGQFFAPNGVPHAAAARSFQQIARLMELHGAKVYAKFETQAPRFDAEDPKTAEKMARLIAEFPNASSTFLVMRQLAAQEEQAGRHAEAAALHRRLLQWPANQPQRAQVLAGLARHYQRHRWPEAARAVWRRLAREHGGQKIAALDPTRTVEEFVADELKRPEYEIVPAMPPNLGLPLSRTWQVRLADEKSERLLSMPSPHADRLFFARNDGALICRDAATGKECWRRTRNESSSRSVLFTWIATQADLVLAAGPDGIAAFAGAGGARLWSFDPASEDGPLASFQLAGGRLYCLQGQRRLWALDAETGNVHWAKWAPGAQVGVSSPGGKFHSFALVGWDRVAVQPSCGQARVLDARTGGTLHRLEARGDPWQGPPVAFDERRVCFRPDPKNLVVFDVSSGKIGWRRAMERPVSLSGEPLQIAAAGDGLLAIVSRNQGHELIRFDAATGKFSWSQPVYLGVERPDLAQASWDRNAIYLPVNGVLHAISPRDGKRLWSCPLGEAPGGWRVGIAGNYLLAHPREADPELPFAPALRRYLPANPHGVYPTSAPFAADLPGILAVLRQAQSPSRFRLVVLDSRDGQLLQRLNFSSRGPQIGASWGERGVVVHLAEGTWGLR